MQRIGGAPTALDKYRVVPRGKVPVEEDEIRVSMVGRMPRYVTYAAGLLNERKKRSITIKATGNAIASAITLAEVLKRRFPNLHQHNLIGMTKSVDTYEPVEVGLDQVTYEREVPFIEITISMDTDRLNTKSPGYQPPIDQSLVRPLLETTTDGNGSKALDLPSMRGRRGGYRGGGAGGAPRGGRDSRGGRGGGRGRYFGVSAMTVRGGGYRGERGRSGVGGDEMHRGGRGSRGEPHTFNRSTYGSKKRSDENREQ